MSAFGAKADITSGLRHHGALTICLHAGGKPASVSAGFGLGGGGCSVEFLEPEVELVTAVVAWAWRGLRLAFRTARRTGDLDMKVLGVTIPGTHLEKPGAISSGLAAQRLLDSGID